VREFKELLDPQSPDGVTVYQLTEDSRGARLVYPDRPCFLEDGRSFVFHGSEGPEVCYLDEGCRTRKLFGAGDAPQGICVYPDGRYVACIRRSDKGGGSFTLSRLDVETFQTEDIFHLEGIVPGIGLRADKLGVATVSSDGRRFAGSVFLGDGTQRDAPFGIVVIEPERDAVSLIAEDRDFNNTHLQYCRSTDPGASHDLLVQMNHGSRRDESGKTIRQLGPPSEGGVDVHVIRDDGTNWRDMPWGRDGQESCIGHQVWRGRGTSAVTVTLQNRDNSYGWADGTRQEVVAGWAAPARRDAPHLGRLNPGGRRIVLSEGFENGRFCHLAVDASGLRFVFDTFPVFNGLRAGMAIYVGSADDEESPLSFRYILNTGMTFGPIATGHAHPILSPSGTELFFNSTISGKTQVYMVTGFDY